MSVGIDVEISIVNHENRALVRACLLSLPDACEGIDWHAVVIDNVSADGSLEMLAADFGHVEVVANQVRLGFGANHNQVLARVVAARSARYALVLNDDTVLRPGAVTQMVEFMDRRPSVGAVVPTVVDQQERVAATRFAYPSLRTALRWDAKDRTEPPDPVLGWLQGCCILFRIAALEQIGLYDERFFLFYEDTDMSRRLTAAGWSLGTCQEASVMHEGHATVLRPGIAEITPLQGRRSRYLYFCKYYGPRRARVIALAGRSLLLARAGKAVARALLRRDPEGMTRASRLYALARFDPRRILPLEAASRNGRAAIESPVKIPPHEPTPSTGRVQPDDR